MRTTLAIAVFAALSAVTLASEWLDGLDTWARNRLKYSVQQSTALYMEDRRTRTAPAYSVRELTIAHRDYVAAVDSGDQIQIINTWNRLMVTLMFADEMKRVLIEVRHER